MKINPKKKDIGVVDLYFEDIEFLSSCFGKNQILYVYKNNSGDEVIFEGRDDLIENAWKKVFNNFTITSKSSGLNNTLGIRETSVSTWRVYDDKLEIKLENYLRQRENPKLTESRIHVYYKDSDMPKPSIKGKTAQMNQIQIKGNNNKAIVSNGIQNSADSKSKKHKLLEHPLLLVLSTGLFTVVAALVPQLLQNNKAKDNDKSTQNVQQSEDNASETNNLIDITQLRPLESLETGLSMDKVADKTFFFVSPLSLINSIEDGEWNLTKVSNKPLLGYSFEIQKIDTDYNLIGFVTEETYSKVLMTDASPDVCVLFPMTYGAAHKPISINIEQIENISYRDIDVDSSLSRITVLDIRLKQALVGNSHIQNLQSK